MNCSIGKLTWLLAALSVGTGAVAQESGAGEEADARAAYEAAIEQARAEEQAANESLDRVRAEMERARAEQARARDDRSQAARDAREAERAAQAVMREELSRVHENLRRTSREVARLHRELDRERVETVVAPIGEFVNLGDRAVIGVILGNSTAEGVRILGVSPDGPADRAGIEQGDVIVSIMSQALGGGSEEPRAIVDRVMEDVAIGDELVIAVRRGDETLEFTVEADRREPFSWQSIVRLPSAPSAPDTPEAPGAPEAPHVLRHVRIPAIDDADLADRLERIRDRVKDVEIHIATDGIAAFSDGHSSYEYRFGDLSDLGGDVLSEASVWFGMPATRGIKMAEMNEGLGEYFGVDEGVLVLSALDDNALQLRAGDVITGVGEHDVAKPADVARALRDWEPGAAIELRIRRDRKKETLKVELPERSFGYDYAPAADFDYHFPAPGNH